MKTFTSVIISVAAFVGFGYVAADNAVGDELLGQWYTADNASKVEIVKRDGKYFGTIIWLSEPNYEAGDAEAGKPKRDRENPETSRKNDPVIGIQVLKNFHYVADEKTWEGGTIYDPENGRTYKCVIRFQDDPQATDGKSLHVRGYIGIPTLGRTTVWYRVPKDDMEETEQTRQASE